MAESESPPTPLTDRAMARLRQLADGNGLAPDAIELAETDEKTYLLDGAVMLTPQYETQVNRYPGASKNPKRLSSFAALRMEIKNRQDQFRSGTEWIPDALKELKTGPAQGWGLDGAQITMPDKSVVLSATETCPTCQGRSLVTCTQCHGQGFIICPQCGGGRQETCSTCGGSGNNPSQPGQSCPTCNGMRSTSCRYCRGTGQLTCPTCQGRRGTPCPSCGGAGQITEEITLNCGATTQFRMKGDGLPSGLRRGLERLGTDNLPQGHADIETVAPLKKEKEEPLPGVAPSREEEEDEAPQPILNYQAKIPYADMRLRFGKGERVVLVGLFGKKGLFLDLPPFLDKSLQPWREKLKKAVHGQATLEPALEARAIREALMLTLSGRGTPQELKKIYTIGFSQDAMKEILSDLQLALKRFTLQTRSVVAIACVALSAALFAGIFLTPLHDQLTGSLNWRVVIPIDLALPAMCMGLGWLILSSSIRFVLQRRFPKLQLAFRQKIGKTGWSMLGGIAAVYIIILALAPVKPAWILYLTSLFTR